MRRLLFRAVLVGLAVGLGQLGAGLWLNPDVLSRAQPVLELGEGERAVVVFGDSVIRHSSKGESDRRTLLTLIREQLAHRAVVDLSHPAYHAGVFLDFAAYLAEERGDLEGLTFLIPINLRSFSPEWDQRPGYQFVNEHHALRPLFPGFRLLLRPAAIFGLIELKPITYLEYLATPVVVEGTKLGEVRNFDLSSARPGDRGEERDEMIRSAMTLHYLTDLDVGHRRLEQLVELADIVEQHGGRATFYATPIDCETGTKLIGPSFRQRIQQKLELITGQLGDKRRWLDLSCDLSAEDFSWKVAPNEHLGPGGRARVAQSLADAVREDQPPAERSGSKPSVPPQP